MEATGICCIQGREKIFSDSSATFILNNLKKRFSQGWEFMAAVFKVGAVAPMEICQEAVGGSMQLERRLGKMT